MLTAIRAFEAVGEATPICHPYRPIKLASKDSYGHRSSAVHCISQHGSRRCRLGRGSGAADASRRTSTGARAASAEFHALEGELIAAQQLLPLNSQSFPGLCVGALAPLRRGASRTSDLCVHQESRGCRSQQSLAGPAAGACANGRPVRRLHEGTHACMWCPTAWARSIRRFRAAALKSPTAPTWCSTCIS